jgi:hypothetical protein
MGTFQGNHTQTSNYATVQIQNSCSCGHCYFEVVPFFLRLFRNIIQATFSTGKTKDTRKECCIYGKHLTVK